MKKDMKGNPSDHLANERTFLAWVRTAIAMMGFGFILVKFSLFLKQISLAAGEQITIHSQKSHSGLTGVLLVSAGVITLLMSYLNYLKIQKQIINGTYQGSNIMLLILTVLLIGLSIFLIQYLITSL